MYKCIYICIYVRIYIYIYIYREYFFVNANFIKHNRHFMSTYFLLDPFELPYYFYRIRGGDWFRYCPSRLSEWMLFLQSIICLFTRSRLNSKVLLYLMKFALTKKCRLNIHILNSMILQLINITALWNTDVISWRDSRERRYSFPWIAPLYPWYVPYIAEC